MDEEILKKMNDLFEKAIDEAITNITCRNYGANGRDWHEDVAAIKNLIKILEIINKNKIVLEPGLNIDLSTATIDGAPIGNILDLKSRDKNLISPYYITARLAVEIVTKVIGKPTARRIRKDPEAFKTCLKNNLGIIAE